MNFQEVELNFRYFIENSITAIFVVDEVGNFIYVNDASSVLTGYSKEELLKMNISEISDVDEEITYKIFNTLKTQKKLKTEIFLTKKDKSKIYVILEATEIPKQNYIGFCTDITKRKEDELELNRYHDRLEEIVQERTKITLQQSEELRNANNTLTYQKQKLKTVIKKLQETQFQLIQSEKLASMGILTAGIAHEMNNPLNFVNASIKALKNLFDDIITVLGDYDSIDANNFQEKLKEIELKKKELEFDHITTATKDLIRNIISGVNRTTEIVKSLRLFSRLDEEERRLEDLNKNIDSILLLMKKQYFEKISIKKNYGKIPKIYCYPKKLNQAFINIITNAIEAINKQNNTKKEIRIDTFTTTRRNKKYIQIDICDTGTGIPGNITSSIFEPFFTTKTTGQGVGLGLFISMGVVKNHKGFIDLKSVVGQGSTFSILIPQESRENYG